MANFDMKKPKTPLVHILRRTDITLKRRVIILAIAIVTAFLVCGLFAALFTNGQIFKFYSEMVDGVFYSPQLFFNFLEETAYLLLIAVAITPAFKMKFWNIGAEGQVLIGALGSAIFLYYLGGKIPTVALIFVCLAGAIVFSIIWGAIPAFFRAHFKTNETLFTLMMNYVAMGLITTFVAIVQGNKGSGVLGVLNGGNRSGWIPTIDISGKFNYSINIVTILVAIVVTILIYLYQNYTKHGYEINVVGGSYRTAKYVGINVKVIIIRTMILSAALCGLCGFLLVNGSSHTVNSSLAGGRGFTAILISWLSEFNPIFMTFYALLVAFITKGSSAAGDAFMLGENFPNVLIGLFFFIIIASTFFLNYRIVFNHKPKAFRKLRREN